MKKWMEAARPRTLPLALSSIIMGGFLAASTGNFNGTVAALSVLTTILLQVLSNFANDYGDTVNGKDTALRQGPSRAVQSGEISAARMKRAIQWFSILSLCSGVLLLYVALGDASPETFGVFLGIGLLCIAAAITYTMGKRPYGYAGLGDISVLIFFGWVGVLGSFYLHTLTWEWRYLLPASSCGLFAVAVLNINNIRDIESDRVTGKHSIPVRIGREAAVRYHWFLLGAGMICPLLYVMTDFKGFWQLLFLLSYPLFIKNGNAVSGIQSPGALDPYLKQMALSTLVFVVLFGAGLLIARAA